jgi:hypothetical protein
MDSAYMGDIMGLIGRHVWKMNFVGTCQNDRVGCSPDAKEAKKRMKIGSYESVMFQHRTECLAFAMWADNNIVKTLSNFHKPSILPAGSGVLRRRRVDGSREKDRTEVSCPTQQKDYSQTFHLIDKGNGKESKYDMGGQTKGHNWAPKLVMRYWNFNLGNAHTMYEALVSTYTPDRRKMDMDECVCFLAHSLMQRGDKMRSQVPEHPNFSRDLTNVFDFGSGRKIRSNAKGTIAKGVPRGRSIPAPNQRERQLKAKQSKEEWRVHQSLAGVCRGRCAWMNCTGLKSDAKRKRSKLTNMRCEQCSAEKGKQIYLCNDVKNGETNNCHIAYHRKYHTKKYADKF